jgi:uncharacterized membrane protein YedE/YeeE
MEAAVALHPESRAGRWQRHVALVGGVLLGLCALALGSENWRHGALLVIGALLGVSLYHAAFGFTSAYRRALVERDVAGHPWTMTWAFTLWGAEAATAFGWEPSTSSFWSGGFPGAALERGILRDNVSIMDLGIIVGALSAAGLAGRFAPSWRVPWRSSLAAILGGLLMGYGARLAFGCNIGAFFSGVASFSLHGWLWIVFALLGTWIGVKLRPLFGLSNEPRGSADRDRLRAASHPGWR